LPFGGTFRTVTGMVIAYHLILTGYGHWLPNDPRGSSSRGFRSSKILDLGVMHRGQREEAPSREDLRGELRGFYRSAQPRLEHAMLIFDAAKRQVLADAFAQVIQGRRYTCFACAILTNHVHLVIRKHRDKAEDMIDTLKGESSRTLRERCDVPQAHPVWSSDDFKKFLYTPEDIVRTVRYVEDNPPKENLPRQSFPFVTGYTGEWSGRRTLREGSS